MPTPERTEVAVLSHVLAHEFNRGYHNWQMAPVNKVNGRAIGNFKQLVEAFSSPVDGKQIVEVEHYSGFAENKGARVVLDAADAAKASPAIMARYGVPSDRSDDLRSR
jgi:hypothetical protein